LCLNSVISHFDKSFSDPRQKVANVRPQVLTEHFEDQKLSLGVLSGLEHLARLEIGQKKAFLSSHQ
jgi:hypothetical protein